MLSKVMNDPKHWGWLNDTEQDPVYSEHKAEMKDPSDASKTIEKHWTTLDKFEMSTWQMLGMTGRNPNKQLQQSSLFGQRKKNDTLESFLFPDNPKFLDGRININIPKGTLYHSGYHGGGGGAVAVVGGGAAAAVAGAGAAP